MIKWQSGSFCQMVNMFSLKQASLLFIQMLKMQNVFEVSATQMEAHRNVLVSSGNPVVFICNISENATKIISWSNDRYHFAYSTSSNQTSSNFSSERLKIDTNIPSKLSISRAQHNDSGLYRCTVTDGGGFRNMAWNLTVKQGVNFSRYIFFILSPAIGLFTCCIMIVVCLCKKSGRGRQDQGPVDNQHQHSQSQPEQIYHLVNLPASTDCWRNTQQRRMYIERLNSIYGHL